MQKVSKDEMFFTKCCTEKTHRVRTRPLRSALALTQCFPHFGFYKTLPGRSNQSSTFSNQDARLAFRNAQRQANNHGQTWSNFSLRWVDLFAISTRTATVHIKSCCWQRMKLCPLFPIHRIYLGSGLYEWSHVTVHSFLVEFKIMYRNHVRNVTALKSDMMTIHNIIICYIIRCLDVFRCMFRHIRLQMLYHYTYIIFKK